jgi:hypothetical protein
MFGKKQSQEYNLLELVPHRLREFDMGEEDIVTINVPRFKHGWMAHYLLPRWKHPNIRTKLDAVGSFVWLQCDGATSTGEIADLLRERFGEEVEPVHDRLKLFLQLMTRRGWIRLHHADGSPLV